MALSHLVDTSVLTRLHVPGVRERVTALSQGTLAVTTITMLEIGFSARNAAEWDQLTGVLAAFSIVDVEPSHIARAARVQRLLADRGLRGRKVPDLLNAAVAEGRDLVVLHYDRDFDLVARVTEQPTDWVVDRGSID